MPESGQSLNLSLTHSPAAGEGGSRITAARPDGERGADAIAFGVRRADPPMPQLRGRPDHGIG